MCDQGNFQRRTSPFPPFSPIGTGRWPGGWGFLSCLCSNDAHGPRFSVAMDTTYSSTSRKRQLSDDEVCWSLRPPTDARRRCDGWGSGFHSRLDNVRPSRFFRNGRFDPTSGSSLVGIYSVWQIHPSTDSLFYPTFLFVGHCHFSVHSPRPLDVPASPTSSPRFFYFQVAISSVHVSPEFLSGLPPVPLHVGGFLRNGKLIIGTRGFFRYHG